MAEQTIFTIWGISILLLLVITAVVALLLTMILRTARGIEHAAGEIWTAGKLVANNTVHIPALGETNRIAGRILETAGAILAGTDALKEHAESCPGCPNCVMAH